MNTIGEKYLLKVGHDRERRREKGEIESERRNGERERERKSV